MFTYSRWKLVILGGIDGFSRSIVYLSCHNNNKAETGLCEFLKGVEKFGLPSCVRTDQGGENVEIAKYMLSHPERGEGRGSHITGKSVHTGVYLGEGCTGVRTPVGLGQKGCKKSVLL